MDMMRKPKATLGQLDQARAKMGMTGAMPDAGMRNKMAQNANMMKQQRAAAPRPPMPAPKPAPMGNKGMGMGMKPNAMKIRK